jgi:20S proteasome subunit alpha 6
MFRNQYDTDVTTFSPAGRIHQVEYAMEAVKQGAAVVGLKSNEYTVIATLKRAPSDLASYQKKLFRIDDHIGIASAGLIADARLISLYMRTECLNHKFVYETPIQAGRLVAALSDKAQVYTQKAEKRPYGVGLLVAAFDKTGTHLYQTQPNGIFFEYKAQAMGARSQSAKTYLEKNFESFEKCPLDELIKHALTALKGASQGPLTTKNVAVGFVGKDAKFTIREDDDLKGHIAQVADDDDDEDEKGEKKKSADDKKKDKGGEPKKDGGSSKQPAASGASAAPKKDEDVNMGGNV